MNEYKPGMQESLKVARLIHTAITLGLLSFGIVVLYLMMTGSASEIVDGADDSNDNVVYLAMGIAGPIFGTGFAFLIRAILGRAASEENAAGIAVVKHIMFIAVLEGGGLLGVVMSLVSGSPAGLAAAALPLVVLLATWPTRARFDPGYDPRDATAHWSNRE